ncbi:MAG: hypothetical protein VX656_09565, partial [Candidatus Latescibacterota bacterium]|nr:hypothetical protein [Candidatus Latescibacterota bacterium]
MTQLCEAPTVGHRRDDGNNDPTLIETAGDSMNKKDELGVLIESGAQNWQIFQRSDQDTASISLSGRWVTSEKDYKKAVVVVRLVREADGEPVTRDLQWVRARTSKSGTWKVTLDAVPAGGLYRLETVLQLSDGPV